MGAVRMLAWCEARRRARAIVALTVLVGIVGAIVLATVAGARRSDTALERFNTSSRSSDLELNIGGLTAAHPTEAQVAALRRAPGVEAVAVLRAFGLNVRGATLNLAIAAATDSRFGRVVDRSRLLRGRRANPAAADETTIGEVLAAQLHVGVGGHLELLAYTQEQFDQAFATNVFPDRPAGLRVRVRVVGIVRRPLDLGDRGATGGVVVLTPAFDRTYTGRIPVYSSVLRVRTRSGAADVPRVVREARKIFGKSGDFETQTLAIETEGAHSAIDVLTVALWVFAGVAALAGLVAISTVLTRELSLMSLDQATLRALGVTRRQRSLTSGPSALAIGGGGALLAVLGAVAASPLLPFGVARRADPDVGLHADWTVLGFGFVAILALVVVIATVAAAITTRHLSSAVESRARLRPSTVVDLATTVGLPPTATNGLRMALERGAGRSAVPVRSAFLGAVFGMLGVSAVLVYAAGVDHLVATPRLSGWSWDLAMIDSKAQECGRGDSGLTRESGLSSVAVVCYQNTEFDGRPATVWGFDSLRGSVEPEVVEGRAARGSGEVALGSTTLAVLHKHIGDRVQVQGAKGPIGFRIVGRVAFPTLADAQPLADGGALTGAGFRRVFNSNSFSRFLVGRVAPGTDRAALVRRLAALPGLDQPTFPTVAVEIDRLRQIDWFPVTLAALLSALALAAVGHALVTAVRRRRRDLALLKTLGFERRQVRATIAWQATTIAAVGLVVGIPAGLFVGRIIWGLVADGLGVSTAAATAATALLLVVPCALALVNLVAFFPARAAARTRPAVALRTE